MFWFIVISSIGIGYKKNRLIINHYWFVMYVNVKVMLICQGRRPFLYKIRLFTSLQYVQIFTIK